VDDRDPSSAGPVPFAGGDRVDGPVPPGTWVEIEDVILAARERTGTLPDDTRARDFVGRTRGFLAGAAALGQRATVVTLTGRSVQGRLRAVHPRNPADFGEPVAELLAIGPRSRRELESPR
jgi:hypothetical protein